MLLCSCDIFDNIDLIGNQSELTHVICHCLFVSITEYICKLLTQLDVGFLCLTSLGRRFLKEGGSGEEQTTQSVL